MSKVFLISILLTLLVLPPASLAAAPDIKEGYDENTELVVRGSVVAAGRQMGGPVVLKLSHKDKVYSIITAPPWYLSQQGVKFAEGAEFEVRGSKYLGSDGNLYLIAREIKDTATGRVISLRDSGCRPMWMGGQRMQNRHP